MRLGFRFKLSAVCLAGVSLIWHIANVNQRRPQTQNMGPSSHHVPLKTLLADQQDFAGMVRFARRMDRFFYLSKSETPNHGQQIRFF